MKADRRKPNRTCKNCGKEFYSKAFEQFGKYGIFCSRKCRLSYNYMIERECVVCKKQFFVKAYELKRKPCSCCSKKCQGILYSISHGTITKKCIVCGNEFIANKSIQERNKCCSKKCSNTAKEKQENCVCAYCGKLFSRKKSQTKSRNKFCSPDCKYSFSVKENNSNWKGGISPERQKFYNSVEWKNLCSTIYRKQNATCQRCGKVKKHGDVFHIHHIISFKNKEYRMNESNLVLLCKKCHNFIHSSKNINKEFLSND